MHVLNIYMRSEQLIWFYCFNRIRHVLLCFCLHSFRTYKITCYFLPAICFHTPNQCIHTHSIVQHFHGQFIRIYSAYRIFVFNKNKNYYFELHFVVDYIRACALCLVHFQLDLCLHWVRACCHAPLKMCEIKKSKLSHQNIAVLIVIIFLQQKPQKR